MNTTTLRKPFVSLAMAAALGLSACAEATQPGAGSGLLPPTPVHVSGTGGTAASGLTAPAEASDQASGRMGMIAPWVIYDYTVGPGMPALPTEANGWQYPPNPTPDLERVAQIAAALGLSGELVARSAEQGGGWMMGPDDGSAPALWVAADAQLSWWFNSSYETVSIARSGCAAPAEEAPGDEGGTIEPPPVPDQPDTFPSDDCVVEEPQPPIGILTADQARARATDLLRQMGADPDQFVLDVYADQWYASVSALQRLGLTASPVGWFFGFGAEGRLDYAGGSLAQPQEAGPYPLIDLDTALARLSQGFYGGPMPLAEDAIAMGAPDVSCQIGADCEQPTEPQHVAVTLTGVQQDLWWTWEANGTAWLLPAFTFLDADGGRHTVPAVTDEYLIMDDVVVLPTPVEPTPLEPEPVEPVPSPSDGTDIGPVISDSDAATLVGLSEDEALATAAERGWAARVVARDGEQFPVTDDYSGSRVNLTITAGTVTSVTVG